RPVAALAARAACATLAAQGGLCRRGRPSGRRAGPRNAVGSRLVGRRCGAGAARRFVSRRRNGAPPGGQSNSRRRTTMSHLRPFAVALAVSLALAPFAGAKAEPARWEIDPEHTTIAFLVSHIGYQRVLGSFTEVSGGFTFDEESRALSDLEVTIGTDSVDSHH